jgi:hypothetical protein
MTEPTLLLPLEKGWSASAREAALAARRAKSKSKPTTATTAKTPTAVSHETKKETLLLSPPKKTGTEPKDSGAGKWKEIDPRLPPGNPDMDRAWSQEKIDRPRHEVYDKFELANRFGSGHYDWTTKKTTSFEDLSKMKIGESGTGADLLKETAKIIGKDPETYARELQAHTEKVTAEAHVWVRVPDKILGRVLEDGRFKNQSETATSKGMNSPGYREHSEEAMFGYEGREKAPLNPESSYDPHGKYYTERGSGNRRFKEFTHLTPEEAQRRPIYGYLSEHPDGRLHYEEGNPKDPVMDTPMGAVTQYGTVAVRLKPSVRSRTTWTGDDSLGTTGRETAYVVGGPTSKTDFHNYEQYTQIYRNERGSISDAPMIPSPLTRPSYKSLMPARPFLNREWEPETPTQQTADYVKKYEPLQIKTTSQARTYFEAQVHGGVPVSDIAEVVFRTKGPSRDLKKHLETAGIPWKVTQ